MRTRAPTSEDFLNELNRIFKLSEEEDKTSITIISGDLHRKVGGYPGPDHRMPVCCSVMKKVMKEADLIISQPPKGKGATLKIQYTLPRSID